MSDPTGRFGGDFEVLSTILAWAEDDEPAALVCVLRTWGSSPRPPGSLMAVRRRDGHVAGSVSGGCVESDLAARYSAGELAACPTVVDYGVDPAGAARFGLPCGGQLELLVEEPEAAALRPVVAAIEAGALIERRVCLKTHEVSLHRPSEETAFRWVDDTAIKVYGPLWRLILVGAGQIADYLSRIAMMLGFHVTVCDPRTGFDSELDVVTVSRQMPDDLIHDLTHRHRTAVVTLAHDPKLDDLALLEALQGGFFYVGALGSRRSSAARRERLRLMDMDEAQLDSLRAPVGIDIGSHTPAEIAVAIAAELTAARNGLHRAV
jgi:xanthine dehydrogenase accessory factor